MHELVFNPYQHNRNPVTLLQVHAFDDCRAKVDWSNCVHHACSEIRAANLSGDCSFMQEMMRGQASAHVYI